MQCIFQSGVGGSFNGGFAQHTYASIPQDIPTVEKANSKIGKFELVK